MTDIRKQVIKKKRNPITFLQGVSKDTNLPVVAFQVHAQYAGHGSQIPNIRMGRMYRNLFFSK